MITTHKIGKVEVKLDTEERSLVKAFQQFDTNIAAEIDSTTAERLLRQSIEHMEAEKDGKPIGYNVVANAIAKALSNQKTAPTMLGILSHIYLRHMMSLMQIASTAAIAELDKEEGVGNA